MDTFGFDKERFPNLQGEMFDCIICSCVARAPKQCMGCGNLFCASCIDSWKKKNSTCPNRCASGSIEPMSSKALIGIYNDLDVQCSKGCKKIVKLSDLQKHEFNCARTKCWNHSICEGYQAKEIGEVVCSDRCNVLRQVLATNGDLKKMYDILIKFKPKQSVAVVSKPTSNGGILKWDTVNTGLGITFEQDAALVILKEAAYVFRTAICANGFTSGSHYWEIHSDQRTENQLKIGVATSKNFDFNTAFCDHNFGFAFYGLGQLRHNSNASGPQYGKRFKKQGVLGCFLNMDKGTLSFSLNGEFLGVAYEDPLLKTGPIYPAVSLLHCAACTIKGEMAIPAIFK